MSRNVRNGLIYFFVSLASIFLASWMGILTYALLILCTVAIVRVLVELFKVDIVRLKYVGIVLLAYILVTVIFGCLYFLLPEGSMEPPFTKSAAGVLDAIYFSFVTTTTLGYGDFEPTRTLARGVVIFQLVLSIITVAVGINYLLGKSLGRTKNSGNTG